MKCSGRLDISSTCVVNGFFLLLWDHRLLEVVRQTYQTSPSVLSHIGIGKGQSGWNLRKKRTKYLKDAIQLTIHLCNPIYHNGGDIFNAEGKANAGLG